MALDRPDDDFTRPEGQVPGSDVPAARSGPAEWRNREEYYEALRAADGKPPEVGDSQADRSGWDSVDAADRPPAEDIGVSPERTTHLADGDETGGGYRHGTGNPGKTESGQAGTTRKSSTPQTSRTDLICRPNIRVE